MNGTATDCASPPRTLGATARRPADRAPKTGARAPARAPPHTAAKSDAVADTGDHELDRRIGRGPLAADSSSRCGRPHRRHGAGGHRLRGGDGLPRVRGGRLPPARAQHRPDGALPRPRSRPDRRPGADRGGPRGRDAGDARNGRLARRAERPGAAGVDRGRIRDLGHPLLRVAVGLHRLAALARDVGSAVPHPRAVGRAGLGAGRGQPRARRLRARRRAAAPGGPTRARGPVPGRRRRRGRAGRRRQLVLERPARARRRGHRRSSRGPSSPPAWRSPPGARRPPCTDRGPERSPARSRRRPGVSGRPPRVRATRRRPPIPWRRRRGTPCCRCPGRR